jgi:hypothetical protein
VQWDNGRYRLVEVPRVENGVRVVLEMTDRDAMGVEYWRTVKAEENPQMLLMGLCEVGDLMRRANQTLEQLTANLCTKCSSICRATKK